MATAGKGQRRLQTLLGVAILLVLSIFGGMLWVNHSSNDFLPELIEKLPENVDLGLERVHYSQNENGQKSWVLDADRAAYQRKDEELSLAGITLVFYHAGSFGQLKLNAETGTLYQKKKLIEMRGDVRIVAATGEDFQTESLQYDFARRRIQTRAPVHMQGQQLELTGIGMDLDLVKGKILILKDVHALLSEESFKGGSQ